MKILVQAIDRLYPDKLQPESVWIDLKDETENWITQTLDSFSKTWGKDWTVADWEENPVDFGFDRPNWQAVFEWQNFINDFGFDIARAIVEFNVSPTEARNLYIGAFDSLEAWAKSYLGNPIENLDLPDCVKDCLTFDYRRWAELNQDTITTFEVGGKIYVFRNY